NTRTVELSGTDGSPIRQAPTMEPGPTTTRGILVAEQAATPTLQCVFVNVYVSPVTVRVRPTVLLKLCRPKLRPLKSSRVLMRHSPPLLAQVYVRAVG